MSNTSTIVHQDRGRNANLSIREQVAGYHANHSPLRNSYDIANPKNETNGSIKIAHGLDYNSYEIENSA